MESTHENILRSGRARATLQVRGKLLFVPLRKQPVVLRKQKGAVRKIYVAKEDIEFTFIQKTVMCARFLFGRIDVSVPSRYP